MFLHTAEDIRGDDVHNFDGIVEGGEPGEVTTTQLWHYRIHLLREECFHLFGRLTNEYLVDMFS